MSQSAGRPRRWSAPLRRCAIVAAAVAAAYPVAVLIGNSLLPAAMRVEPALMLVVTAFNPLAGLLLVAAIAPLGELIVPLLGAQPVNHAETVVLAFLAGWLGSRAVSQERRPQLPASVGNAMFVFAAIVVASLTTTALELYREAPAQFDDVWTSTRAGYLSGTDPIGLHVAAGLLEGLLLTVAAVSVIEGDSGRRAAVAGALVAGSVGVAVASTLLSRGIASANILSRQARFGFPRYATAVGDVNAAASAHLLLVPFTAAMALHRRRQSVVWAAATLILSYGVWLTGSWAAFFGAATVVALTVMLAVARTRRAGVWVAIAVAAASVAAGAWVAMTWRAGSVGMRADFMRASARMVAARPVFGIGVGRYWNLSVLTLPPSLGWSYGRENAHNYFAQTAAELGLVGAAAFIWLVGAVLSGPAAALRNGRRRWLAAGILAGIVAYLATAMAGHPLLVAETAVPFWLMLGLATTCVPEHTKMGIGSRRTVLLATLVLATVPWRAGTPRLGLRPGDDGFLVEPASDGTAREMKPAASLFVGPSVTAVDIPLRLDAGRPGSATVGVFVPDLGDRFETRVSSNWASVRVNLPGAGPLTPRQRINLAVLATDPAPPPGAAAPAVYVGDIRIVATSSGPYRNSR